MSTDLSLAESRLRELVEIESPTGYREGIEACFQLVNSWAAPLFGRAGELRETEGVTHLYWPAVRDGGVLILGHIDTVWPIGTLACMPFVVDEGHAKGPGTFDMKAGIIAAVGALELLDHLDDVGLLLTGDEETGSLTSRPLIEEAALRAGAVLIFEPSLAGALKVARRGAGMYRLTAHGKAAHAGLDPELGENALIELCHQVLKIASASSVEHGTNVTPTVLKAGTTQNTVPDLAEVGVDVRAWSVEELQRVDDFMRALEPENPEIHFSLTGGINRPPMQRTHAQALFEIAAEVGRELGLSPLEAAEVGGGSDGNFTAALGVPTLDGFGPYGDGAHAPHEWVRLSSVPERSRLVAGLIQQLRATTSSPLIHHDAEADRSTQ